MIKGTQSVGMARRQQRGLAVYFCRVCIYRSLTPALRQMDLTRWVTGMEGYAWVQRREACPFICVSLSVCLSACEYLQFCFEF